MRKKIPPQSGRREKKKKRNNESMAEETGFQVSFLHSYPLQGGNFYLCYILSAWKNAVLSELVNNTY